MRKGFLVIMALVAFGGFIGCTNPSSPQPKKFTVTYDANGATAGSVPAPQQKTEGSVLTLAANDGSLSRQGYSFVGWNTAADAAGTAYACGSAYSADADATLYASWKADSPAYTSATVGTLNCVPAGSFHRDSNAKNISVVAKEFRIGKYEITRAQFSAVMGFDPTLPAKSTGLTDPVLRASWYQAISFCNKLSIAESLKPVYAVTVSGIAVDFKSLTADSIPTASNADWNAVSVDWSANGYRLPTEMEWQWAAMGATDSYAKKFAGSDGSNSINDFAVYGYPDANNVLSTLTSSPVGSKRPNELGLYDMSGNAYEWCWDWYAFYPAGSVSSDTDAGRGPASGKFRIIRGGHWFGSATDCAVASRNYYAPTTAADYTGFRVVRN